MSLFRDSLRPPPLASDEAVRRYLIAIRAGLDPDPLFRRRLRGVVVNRFVAAREGSDQRARRGSAMGRLGRACLYASVVVAMSVGGVMAASQAALPGDVLYPLKRNVEALRLQLLPVHLHDDLAVYVLSERINELGRLVEAGELEQAATLAGPITEGYQKLSAIGPDAPLGGMLESRVEALAIVLEGLPPQALAAIERAMQHAPGLDGAPPPGWWVEPGKRSGNDNAGANGAGLPGVSPVNDDGTATPGNNAQKDQGPAIPTASETAEPSPKEEPSPTVRETPSPEPSPTPRPSPGSRGLNAGSGGP